VLKLLVNVQYRKDMDGMDICLLGTVHKRKLQTGYGENVLGLLVGGRVRRHLVEATPTRILGVARTDVLFDEGSLGVDTPTALIALFDERSLGVDTPTALIALFDERSHAFGIEDDLFAFLVAVALLDETGGVRAFLVEFFKGILRRLRPGDLDGGDSGNKGGNKLRHV